MFTWGNPVQRYVMAPRSPWNLVHFKGRWERGPAARRRFEILLCRGWRFGIGTSSRGHPPWETGPSPEIHIKRTGTKGIWGVLSPHPPKGKNFLIESICNYQLILKGCGLLRIAMDDAVRIHTAWPAWPPPLLPAKDGRLSTVVEPSAHQGLLGFQCLTPPARDCGPRENPLWPHHPFCSIRKGASNRDTMQSSPRDLSTVPQAHTGGWEGGVWTPEGWITNCEISRDSNLGWRILPVPLK